MKIHELIEEDFICYYGGKQVRGDFLMIKFANNIDKCGILFGTYTNKPEQSFKQAKFNIYHVEEKSSMTEASEFIDSLGGVNNLLNRLNKVQKPKTEKVG